MDTKVAFKAYIRWFVVEQRLYGCIGVRGSASKEGCAFGGAAADFRIVTAGRNGDEIVVGCRLSVVG